MAPTPSSRPRGVVSKKTKPRPDIQAAVSPPEFIDRCLRSFSEQALGDVIRVARRILQTRAQSAREADKGTGTRRTWRFWDRPLELDWNSQGLPKVQYPRHTSEDGQQVDWRVFELLKGSACEPMQVDWEIFNMLTPEPERECVDWEIFELLSPTGKVPEGWEELGVGGELCIDWSGDGKPMGLEFMPPRRRPGRPGRVRAGRHHRAIEPQRRERPTPEVLKAAGLCETAMSMVLPKTSQRESRRSIMPPRTLPNLRRTPAGIHQPCGARGDEQHFRR